jgi:hypothetical protein
LDELRVAGPVLVRELEELIDANGKRRAASQ